MITDRSGGIAIWHQGTGRAWLWRAWTKPLHTGADMAMSWSGPPTLRLTAWTMRITTNASAAIARRGAKARQTRNVMVPNQTGLFKAGR